jgi:hypothetical protein
MAVTTRIIVDIIRAITGTTEIATTTGDITVAAITTRDITVAATTRGIMVAADMAPDTGPDMDTGVFRSHIPVTAVHPMGARLPEVPATQFDGIRSRNPEGALRAEGKSFLAKHP